MRFFKKEENYKSFLERNASLYSKEELINQIKEEHSTYKKKYRAGYTIFLSLNIIIFVISSILVVLNLFAIRLNESPISRPYFIAIAFITGTIAFLTSLNSFFEFKNLQKDFNEKIKFVENEYDKFKKDIKTSRNPEKLFSEIIEALNKVVN